MSLSSNTIRLDLTALKFGKSSDVSIGVSTDNSTGYTMTIYGEESGDIDTGNDTKISSVATATSEAGFNTSDTLINKWGYRPSQYVSNTGAAILNENYLPIPSNTGQTLAKTEEEATDADAYTLSVGAKIGNDILPGTYHYTYTITVVSNLVPALPWNVNYYSNLDDDAYDIPEKEEYSIDDQTDEYPITLSSLIPQANEKAFLGWCDIEPETTSASTCAGTIYHPGDTYNIDTASEDHNVNFYALWENTTSITITYVFAPEVSFEGKSYLDTGIQLFSTENVNKDFKISTGIKDYVFLSGQDRGFNTVLSDMSEAGSPYPGFAIRNSQQNNRILELTRNNSRAGPTPAPLIEADNTNYISLFRKNQILYYNTNTIAGTSTIDYTGVPTFSIPLTFGAALDANGNPFRYLKGAIENPTVSIMNYDVSSVTTILPAPTITDELFVGWYSDPEFRNKVGNEGEEVTSTEKTTLYARWAEKPPDVESYSHEEPVTFDGTNYINSEVRLYSRANINRNYEISFNIDSYGSDNTSQATIMNSLNEFDRKYPGIVFRTTTENTNNTEIRNSTNGSASSAKFNNLTGTVKILRLANKIYYSVSDGTFVKFSTVNPPTDWSNTPVTFGASVDEDGNPFRNFKGTLSNISVKFLPDDTTIEDYEAPTKATEVVYSYSGARVFDGPCVPSATDDCSGEDTDKGYIDTGVYLFNEANYQKDFSISFETTAVGEGNATQAVLMNAMKEGASPWPGTVFRYELPNPNSPRYELVINKSGGSSSTKYNISTTNKVEIMRKSGIVYVKINDDPETRIFDLSNFSTPFDVPVTFGAGLDGSGNPFRYFHGTISNMVIKLEPNENASQGTSAESQATTDSSAAPASADTDTSATNDTISATNDTATPSISP